MQGFSGHRKKYESNPTDGYATAYAGCLLARGGEDLRAISILEAEISLRNNVGSADFLALYIATGGTMKQYQLDEDNYNEALQAYAQTLHLINHQPDYPKGFVISEEAHQYELTAYRYMVHISYNKYIAGLNTSTYTHLLQSPSYQGDRDLELYPQYSPYTLDSLQQTIENATICANLPKKAHFQPKLYLQTIEYCQVTKRIVEELVVLEQKRLTFLNQGSCAQDIVQCSEYKKVLFQEINSLTKEKLSEVDRIWNSNELARL